MKRLETVLGLVLLAGSTGFVTSICLAATDEAPPAAAYYALVGNWHGSGELAEPGQPPAKLDLDLVCREAASGWSVACDLNAQNESMTMTETDLMGVDSVTGQGYWYAITSSGDTHDHLSSWPDANTMKARYTWTQDGKGMEEDITLKFSGKDSLAFRSTVTADGAPAGNFSGTLSQ
jgi:hypothetical protein